MTTQHLYRRTWVGFCLLGLLVALYGVGCAKSVATGHQALPYTQAEESPANAPGMAGASGGETVTISDEPGGEAGEMGEYMGYRDPMANEMPLSVGEEAGRSGTLGDMDESRSDTATPWMGGHEEEAMRTDDYEHDPEMNNPSGFVDRDDATYRETPWTPSLDDREATPEQTGDKDEGCSDKPTPWTGEGNESRVGANSSGMLPDDVGTAGADEGTVTVEQEPDGIRYEGNIADSSNDMESGESGNDLNAESPP